MIPFRAQVKLFLENPEAIPLAAFTGVFQRWIQQKALEGLLIDVADYRHVFEGPGVILIGHESDYGIENREGRLGLLFTRKRQFEPDLPTQLRTSLRLALAAAVLLESDPAFEPRLKFRADEVEIRFPDRLQLPNRPETFDLIKEDVGAVLSELYGAHPFQFAPVDQDSRNLFMIRAQAEGMTGIAELLPQFQAKVEG
jgi:hypothetical protein